MSDDLQLRHLADQCGKHTSRFKQGKPHNPSYCYKLFELALKDRNERAWEFLYNNYKSQLENAAQRHPKFSDCDEDAEYFVHRAFERMLKAITPDKFESYKTLPQLVKYMQMCVGTAILDHKKKPSMADIDDVHHLRLGDHASLDTSVLHQEFWHCVEQLLKTNAERYFVRGHFIWGYKPRELCEELPEIFPTTQDVNRVRTSLINRLKRNIKDFLKCVGDDSDAIAAFMSKG